MDCACAYICGCVFGGRSGQATHSAAVGQGEQCVFSAKVAGGAKLGAFRRPFAQSHVSFGVHAAAAEMMIMTTTTTTTAATTMRGW